MIFKMYLLQGVVCILTHIFTFIPRNGVHPMRLNLGSHSASISVKASFIFRTFILQNIHLDQVPTNISAKVFFNNQTDLRPILYSFQDLHQLIYTYFYNSSHFYFTTILFILTDLFHNYYNYKFPQLHRSCSSCIH